MALGLKKKPKAKAPEPKRRLSIQQAKPVDARRQAFIDHYLATNNVTKAAILAGYSKKTAASQGSRLLKDAKIAAVVDARRATLRETLVVNAETVKAEVAKLAFASVGNFIKVGADGAPYVDFSAATKEHMAGLQAVTIEEFKDGRSDKREVRRVKVTLGDKSRNLENLMKHFGMLKDVVDVNHKHEVTVMGLILKEIDEEGRPPVIEHK